MYVVKVRMCDCNDLFYPFQFIRKGDECFIFRMMRKDCDKSIQPERKKREMDKKINGQSDKSSRWLKGGKN